MVGGLLSISIKVKGDAYDVLLCPVGAPPSQHPPTSQRGQFIDLVAGSPYI